MIWQVGFTTIENNIRAGTAYHEASTGDGSTYTVSALPGVCGATADDGDRRTARSSTSTCCSTSRSRCSSPASRASSAAARLTAPTPDAPRPAASGQRSAPAVRGVGVGVVGLDTLGRLRGVVDRLVPPLLPSA